MKQVFVSISVKDELTYSVMRVCNYPTLPAPTRMWLSQGPNEDGKNSLQRCFPLLKIIVTLLKNRTLAHLLST